MAAKKLAAQLGGVEAAKQAIDALSKLANQPPVGCAAPPGVKIIQQHVGRLHRHARRGGARSFDGTASEQ